MSIVDDLVDDLWVFSIQFWCCFCVCASCAPCVQAITMLIHQAYTVEPAKRGIVVPIAHGSGRRVPVRTDLINRTPKGTPTKTPYQKPFSSFCLKFSNATLIAVWSYESYLKSAILNILTLIDKILRFFIIPIFIMPRCDQLSFLMLFIVQKILGLIIKGQSVQTAQIYCLPVESEIISMEMKVLNHFSFRIYLLFSLFDWIQKKIQKQLLK